jgi:poly(3-hydroxybutyrate) depolymerase
MSRVVDLRSSLVCSLLCLSCGASEQPAPASAGGTSSSQPAGGAGAATSAAGSAVTIAGSAGTASSGGSSAAGGASAGAATGGGAGGPSSVDQAASKTALEQLKAWLALGSAARPELGQQAFAKVALSKSDAAEAKQLLVADYTAQLKQTRASEVGATESVAKTLKAGDVSMRYYRAERGQKPATGWHLFISMHGGGDADTATNDSQWENQLALVDGYEPKNALWIAPRAPTDEWNMWFREHLDALFERLIADLIAFEGVDPNHVYLNGYSAGGDGAYQMGPRMADAWAGVGMSAGHPNDASPLSLRNTAFAIHVGGDDSAYDRNLKGAEWGKKLDDLAAADAGGYPHQWQVHAGLPHWMELQDAVSIPFLQGYARDPIPRKVVWRQSSTLRSRFYWLAVSTTDVAAGAELTASYAGQTLKVDAAKGVKRLTLRVTDAMLDQDQPVSVQAASGELYSGTISRTIAVLYATLVERGDPSLMFAGEVSVALD